MAGLVQAVLTDKELDALLRWADFYDLVPEAPLTESDRALRDKLDSWRTSCDCKTD